MLASSAHWQLPVGFLLIVLGAIPIICLWLSIGMAARRRHQGGISMVPPIFGLMLMVGLMLVGVPTHLAWIGLIVDPGILLVVATPWLVYHLWSWSRYCRLNQFISKSDGKTVTISLFKRGKASILFKYHKPTNEIDTPHCISRSLAGNWETAGKDISLSGFPEWHKAILRRTGNRYQVCQQGEEKTGSDIRIDGMLFKEKPGSNGAS